MRYALLICRAAVQAAGATRLGQLHGTADTLALRQTMLQGMPC
jgi:hypothetical protein